MTMTNEKLRAKKLLYCKFYKGPARGTGKLDWPETCEVGVRYDSFKCKPLEKPCHTGGAGCSKFCGPTMEEIIEQEQVIEKSLAQIGVARKAVTDAAAGARGVGGRINCPVCGGKGTLRYSIASNGHVHGHCSTDGCVGWME